MQHSFDDEDEDVKQPSHGGSSSHPPEKKRRVTKACDQCRRKRIKCEADTDPSNPSCLVCIDAGTPEQCTFTRPSKKRGPQAGHAKSLTERVNSLERLLGHLIILNSPLLDSASASFFNPTPYSPTPQQQISSFNGSPYPALLDALPSITLPAPVPASKKAKTSTASPNDSDRIVVDNVDNSTDLSWTLPPDPSSSSPHIQLPTPSTSQPIQPQPPTGFPAAQLSLAQRKVLGLWSPVAGTAVGSGTTAGGSSNAVASTSAIPMTPLTPQDGLHTLATAAMGRGMDVEHNYGSPTSSSSVHTFVAPPPPVALPPVPPNNLSIPSLPSEAIRNQLVDLYFNQVVHPTYPILDKSQFFRWSAHAHLAPSISPPPELYLSVFALSVPYLSPAVQKQTHASAVFANAARNWLWEGLKEPTVERVQAAGLLALVDWGTGETKRAWALSGLALTLSLSLSLHLPSSTTTPTSLKTFHAILMIHTLLSLRLSLPPLISHSSYKISLPQSDGPENFELWRSDKSSEELRSEYSLYPSSSSSSTSSSHPDLTRRESSNRTQAVRLSAGATFSKMAELCAIAVGVWKCLNGEEGERSDVGRRLEDWEKGLPGELRLGEGEGIEWIEERSRVVVEMHLLKAVLGIGLGLEVASYGTIQPVSWAHISHLAEIISRYSSQYTFYRSLPSFELFLHSLAEFDLNSTVGGHGTGIGEIANRALVELGRVWTIGSLTAGNNQKLVEGRRREYTPRDSKPLDLSHGDYLSPISSNSGPSPLASSVGPGIMDFFPSPTPSTPHHHSHSHIPPPQTLPYHLPLQNRLPPHQIAQPLQPLPLPAHQLQQPLIGGGVGGSTGSVGEISQDTLNYTQWDQSDLLISLGLVVDPNQGWREEGEGLVGTDLLNRWLDRGAVGWDV